MRINFLVKFCERSEQNFTDERRRQVGGGRREKSKSVPMYRVFNYTSAHFCSFLCLLVHTCCVIPYTSCSITTNFSVETLSWYNYSCRLICNGRVNVGAFHLFIRFLRGLIETRPLQISLPGPPTTCKFESTYTKEANDIPYPGCARCRSQTEAT